MESPAGTNGEPLDDTPDEKSLIDELEGRIQRLTEERDRLAATLSSMRDAAPASDFGEVLDNSRDIVYRLNLKTGAYDYVSPSSKELLGYSSEEMNKEGFENLASRFHPEDMAKYKDHFDKLIQHTVEDEIQSEIQYRWRHRDGEYRWYCDNRSVLRDSHGGAIAIVGNVRDITETKEAERELRESDRRFRQVADNIRELFLVWDAKEKRVLYVSPAYEEILGGARVRTYTPTQVS